MKAEAKLAPLREPGLPHLPTANKPADPKLLQSHPFLREIEQEHSMDHYRRELDWLFSDDYSPFDDNTPPSDPIPRMLDELERNK